MTQIVKTKKKIETVKMIEEVIDFFKSLEREQIEPFQVISRSQVLKKLKEFIRKYKEFRPKDNSSFPERLANVLKCKTSRIDLEERKITRESEESESTTRAGSIKNNRGMELLCKAILICLDCTEKEIGKKVDELNEILERNREQGVESVMVTVVIPSYFKEKITRKELCDLFHRVIGLFRRNREKLLKDFFIMDLHRIEELAWKLDNFENYFHVHLIVEFENKENRVKFQKVEEEFREYVFRKIERVFKNYGIKDEEYTRRNCVYFSKEDSINPKTGMKDLIVLENGEYFRKTYEKDLKTVEKLSECRYEYFKANSKNFDKEKRVFKEITEGDLELIEKFYKEVLPKCNSRGNKTFCLHNWVMAMLGGGITKEDKKLKEEDRKAYNRRVKLKMYGLKKMFDTIECYYGDKKEGISRLPSILYPLWSFSRKSVKLVGGSKEIKARAKERRIQRFEEIKEERLQNEKDCRIETKAKLTQDEEIRRNAEENRKKIGEILEIKQKLTKAVGLSLDKIEKEILRRTTVVHSITWDVSDYLNSSEETPGVNSQSLYDCLIDEEFKEYDKLDRKNGLKKLYEFTEKYKVDRSGVRINHFRFEGDEYCKYFPYIRVDRKLEKKFKERTGMTLREFDELEVIYSLSELEGIIERLSENSKERVTERITEEEFRKNVDNIIEKAREFDREHPTNRSKYY